jgi:hypothetical protein
VELPQPAAHASRRRIEPAVCAARLRIAAEELRRYIAGEPLHNVVQAAI